jgi:hypothetical protein
VDVPHEGSLDEGRLENEHPLTVNLINVERVKAGGLTP